MGRCLSLFLFACFNLFPFAASSSAQDKPEKVHFTSADGVELQGTFYTSSKRSAPTVLLLHALGESSRKKGWTDLAEELQKAGYCVLGFDFRGHGNSTEVNTVDFWKVPYNKSLVKGVGKATIDYKNFAPNYLPVLVNDIAAAKAYLDRSKNDNGTCNTSSLIVIGAETGATLGAIWVNSEWHRFKLNPPMIFGQPAQPDIRPEGKDIISCIWLSISPTLGGRKVSPALLLESAGKTGATPMVFMFSDKDLTGKTVAKGCEKYLKVPKDDKYKYTLAHEIKGNAKLSGRELLQKSLGTDKAIVDYLEEVVQAKGNEWAVKDFRKTQYVWRSPMNPQMFIPAKILPANDQNLAFDTYEKFIPQR